MDQTANFSCHKQSTFSCYTTFTKFLYILHFLYAHRYLKINNITPHSPDDGSSEPKLYSVDFVSQ